MVNLEIFVVGTWATLLSGLNIYRCRRNEEGGFDSNCLLGVVNVDAFLRHRSQTSDNTTTTTRKQLVVSRLETNTAFVQMHPLDWNVNALILNGILGWNFFVGTHSILYQNGAADGDLAVSTRDLSDLQQPTFPFVLSNAQVPPTVSWHGVTEAIYWDNDSHVAVTSFVEINDAVFGTPSLATAKALMDRIYRLNQQNGCQAYASSYTPSLIQQYREVYVDANGQNVFENNEDNNSDQNCWIPLAYISTSFGDEILEFVKAMAHYQHPPAVIIGIGSVDDAGTWAQPQKIGNHTWTVIYPMNARTYYEHKLVVSNDNNNDYEVVDLQLFTENLWELPEQYKDEIYANRLNKTIALAEEALEMNRIVGYSGAVGDPRSNDERNYRYCKGGECEVGNLFTDSLRWKTKSDVAFLTSGGFRGTGWEAGPVRITNIWNVMSFDNTICTAKMSGVSLFRLFNYSTSWATFESAETDEGGRLLQVSGVRVTYNTQLSVSRLVRLEVWDEDTGSYQDVERLRIYNVASDSWVCGAYVDYPDLLGVNLTINGEQQAVISDTIIQDAVADFLAQYPENDAYDPSVSGRLVNDTSVVTTLNLVQTEENCEVGTFWIEDQQTCESCPDTSGVQWFRELVEFSSVSGSSDVVNGDLTLVNGASFAVTLSPKTFPSWVTLVSNTKYSLMTPLQGSTGNSTANAIDGVVHSGDSDITLQTGERINLHFEMSSANLDAGTAVGTISFGVADGGDFPGCDGRDASFEVSLRVLPLQDDNYLGSIRWVGWGMAIVIVAASTTCAVMILAYRKLHIVRTLQPTFLVGLSVGVGILGTSLIPLSLDDEIVSQHGMDIACMATPWLLSMGFTVAFSALFSKLWRINKLFSTQQFRRKQVREKDVLLPFAILFCLNVGFLLTWTVVDPLRWERNEIDGEEWNTFGQCKNDGVAGNTLMGLVVGVNFAALFGTCWQAYNARNLSDEFSESRNIAIALYSWFQLLVVSVPVIFLVDQDSVTAKYFLLVGIISAVCGTMLACIFAPILVNARTPRTVSMQREGRIHVSGAVGSSATSGSGFASSLRNSDVTRMRQKYAEELGIDLSNDSKGSDEPEAFQQEWSSTAAQPSQFSLASGLDPLSKRSAALESINEREEDISETEWALREQTSSELMKKNQAEAHTTDGSSSADPGDERGELEGEPEDSAIKEGSDVDESEQKNESS